MKNGPSEDASFQLRVAVYALLIVCSTGAMIGRVLAVKAVHIETGGGRIRLVETPLLSANDRSRWSTVRCLVDHRTYAIDRVIYRDRGERDKLWYTIDLVRHRGPDGQEHSYSSKPPLLSTLLAGLYWLIKTVTAASLANQTFYVVRWTLVIAQVVPLAVYFVLLARLVENWGTTDLGRMYVMAAATWGTFLTTFAVTINNHLPAAVSVLIAIFAVQPAWRGQPHSWRSFACAGFFAALAAANELPALSFFVLLGAALLYRFPRLTLSAFVPAAGVVLAGFFATNYLAHQSLRPPYLHRNPLGTLLVRLGPETATDLEGGRIPSSLRERLREQGCVISDRARLSPREAEGRWMLWDAESQQRLAIAARADSVDVHQWDDWYDYENSYWTSGKKQGVDRGEQSRLVYAFHVLLGHHGIFSLTPIWLFSAAGVAMMFFRQAGWMRSFALLVLILTVVCLAFYLTRPLADRNYGGVSCTFRWMIWFTPLWLLAMVPAVDCFVRQGRGKWLRCTALVAVLLVSVVSASYAGLNPWSHPWLFRYWEYLQWIHYQ